MRDDRGFRLSESTKASTLVHLQGRVRRSIIDPFIVFSARQWRESPLYILATVADKFGAERVIVRSSAIEEDKPGLSYAGYFRSELVESASRRDNLSLAIDKVVSSYSRDDRHANLLDQFMVQRHIDGVICSGVILTRDWPSLAPYYVIDFDDETGRTDTVTKGHFARQLRIARWALQDLGPSRWKAPFLAVCEIEEILATDSLQLEFAVDRLGIVHIFQVRSLACLKAGFLEADDIVKDVVESLQEDVRRIKGRGTHSRCTLLADMSDWNPAEMLGSRCNELDYSLYRLLITDSNWNAARVSLGYADVRPYELMQRIADKPYIDVGVSLCSLIPAGLSPGLSDRLVEFGVCKICNNPALQDKIEFSAAFSCYDFYFEQKACELRDAGFSAKEINLIRSHVLELTNKLLSNSDAILERSLRAVSYLDRERERLKRKIPGMPLLEVRRSVRAILATCRDYGVLPFAQAARLSFIGIALLRSIARSEEDEKFIQDFLTSVKTIAGQMTHDFGAIQRGRISRERFLQIYGHLRPGTYNIAMSRLDQVEDLFDVVASGMAPRRKRRRLNSKEANLDHIDLLLKEHGLVCSTRGLLEFSSKTLKARELLKFKFTKTLSEAIEIIAGIGAELGFTREEMAFLDIETIAEGATENCQSEWRSIIDHRSKQQSGFRLIALPPIVAKPEDLVCFEYYKAKPNFVNCSRVEGPIAILSHDSPHHSLAGRVVLIENADPGYDWLFSCNILALITKYGGVASHMAIRCGEFGLPAAIGCGEVIFNNICKGSRVCIDGQTESLFIVA